ncbi:MAG: apolipoprotein N-acyltransferase [Bacteroidota bacterium]
MKIWEQKSDIHPLLRRVQWAGLLVSLVALAGLGYRMKTLDDAQQLWGTLPLLFEICLWLSFVSLRLRTVNLRWLAFSTLSGALLTLSFPNFWTTPLIFVAFVPLLFVESEISNYNGISKKLVLRYAVNAFMVWNIGATWWVCNSSLVAGMIANFLNALLMTVPFLAFHQLKNLSKTSKKTLFFPLSGRLRGDILGGAAFVSFWLGFEMLHLNWDMSWSWLTLGNAFSEMPNLVQFYEFTGVMGGSAWALLLNFLLFLILKKKEKFENKKLIFASGLVLTIPLAVSFLLGNLAKAENSISQKQPASHISAVVVQPNYEPHYVKFSKPEITQVNEIIALASQKVDSTTDFLILPETVVDNVEVKQGDNREQNMTRFREFTRHFPKLKLVMGIGTYEILQGDEIAKHNAVRTAKRGGFSYEAANAATVLRASDTTPQYKMPVYRKSKLVPGPEILPFKKVLFFLKPLFDQMGGTIEGLGTQPTRENFGDADCKVAPVICYESIFGDFCTGYVRNGANFLAVMTNDGWWDDSPGYLQHLKFARLRAIELRRPVVRAANSGASCWIDILGNVHQQTVYNTQDVQKFEFQKFERLTFYAKFGDWLGIFASILSIFGLFYLFFEKISRNRKK